jgi:hypothetical protein
MLVRILLSVLILFLVAAVSLLIRILKSSKAADDVRRREVLQHDLGDDVLWSRGGGAKEAPGVSRRTFIPNIATGIAALYLFKSAARAATSATLADTKNDPPPPKHSDRAATPPPKKHSDAATDVPHSDARVADVPHSDKAGAQRPMLAQNHSDARRSDVPHSDKASTPPPKHSDARQSDVPHSDARKADVPHSDKAGAQRPMLAQNHSDARRPDVPHSDARRTDVPHSDAANV